MIIHMAGSNPVAQYELALKIADYFKRKSQKYVNEVGKDTR